MKASFTLLMLLRVSCAAVPPWPPTYRLASSTIIMPANGSGLWNYSNFSLAQFGIVDFDQSANKIGWVTAHPWDASRTMLAQAAAARAAAVMSGNPGQHIWLYRSSVKLIPYLPSVYTVLTDVAFAPWFLRYATDSPVNSPCDHNFVPPRCSALFHDQWGLPTYPGNDSTATCIPPGCDCGENLPCGEYYIDFRRWIDTPIRGQTLADWWTNNYTLQGSLVGSGGLVDGVFMDDVWDAVSGPSEASPGLAGDTGLSQTDIADIAAAWAVAAASVRAAVESAGGFSWQSFYNNGTNPDDLVRQGHCVEQLRMWCSASSPAMSNAILFGWTGAAHGHAYNSSYLEGWQQDLVNFLLIRGQYAWLGYGWQGVSAPYYMVRNFALRSMYHAIVLFLCRSAA